MAGDTFPLVPGHSLGTICLGASLQEVLTIFKSNKDLYPKLDLYFDRTEPLRTPVVIGLPDNGLRLRFDGADQRLRLIEVMDFRKTKVTYKGSELIRSHEAGERPAFKRIYQIFGASYPGEYYPPKNGSSQGDYVLSWTGVAFTFPLQHAAWSAGKDHVSVLGSSAASPAARMAVFEGNSWPEVQKELFVRTPTGSRSSAVASRPKDNLPAELELATIQGDGGITFVRRAPAAPFSIVINETTPQDLITELGPPDATHKRDAYSSAQDQPVHRRTESMSRPMSNGRAGIGSQPSSYSSTGTDTFDVDFDSGDAEEDPAERASRDTFWSYFTHGMDILVGPPSQDSSTTSQMDTGQTPLAASPHLVVTKVIIHGNVPGSYAFNRHRRLRWRINLPNTEYAGDLTSESKFDDLKPSLIHIFQNVWQASEMGKGRVINRTWGAGSSDSSFFLPDAGEDLVEGGGGEQWLGNTRLYTFPGMVFEVLENGAVSALTIY